MRLHIYGDSVAAGAAASAPERKWAHIVARRLEELAGSAVEVSNFAVGASVLSPRSRAYGASTKPSMIEQIERHEDGADVAILACGLNDVRGGTPVQNFTVELNRALDLLVRRKARRIVVVGPYHIVRMKDYGPNWCHADAGILRDYARTCAESAARRSAGFVDALAAMDGREELIAADGVHPNDLGHAVIASAVWNVLRPVR